MINASRDQHGVPRLALDAALTGCALRHSQNLESCTGGQPAKLGVCGHRDFRMGDTCGSVGENQGVAGGGVDRAFRTVHEAMMAEGPPPAGSINHYWHLVRPVYTHVGIGIHTDANGNTWVTELFR